MVGNDDRRVTMGGRECGSETLDLRWPCLLAVGVVNELCVREMFVVVSGEEESEVDCEEIVELRS